MTPRAPRPAPLAAAATLALTLAACAGTTGTDAPAAPGDDAADVTALTVVLDWTVNTNHAGLYLARERGYFADAGLEVEILEPGDISGLQLVATGDADIAYSVAESLVPAVEGGVDAVSIAAVIEHNTSSLLFENSTGITRPRDLPGHVYGSYDSPLENALISTLVSCDGGDPAGIETAPLATDDFRIGLTEDQFDYVWVYDAWDTIRLRDVDGMDVGTIAFIDHTDCIPDWYTPLLATSRAQLAEDPDAVRAFLDAVTRGYQDAMAEPSAAAEAVLAASPELDRELVEASAEYLATHYAEDPAGWGRQTAGTWDGFIGFLAEHDIAGADLDPASLWTNDYLPAAGE